MIIQRAYKFRIEPNADQRKQLAIDFGCARWVWNTCLAWRSNEWETDKSRVTGIDFSRELTFLKSLEPYIWLKDANSTVLTQKLMDQDRAFKNFFEGRAKYPKFKKKHGAQSVRYQLDQRQVAKMYLPGNLLKLPKIGALKVRWSKIPTGIPKMVTVIKDACGRYFVSFMCEEHVQPLPQKTNAIGVDVGIKDVVVTSEGWKSGNPRHLRRLERKLKRAQRALSRKVKGSNRRRRQRLKVARLHARVADARRDFLHKLSTSLINQAQVIAVEDLNVRGMMGNHRLAKSIGDVGFAELRLQIEYKAKWYGREIVVADRFAPTSKTCSDCGSYQKEMPLKIREWTCPDCATVHDRDVNAAKNVLFFGTLGSSETYKARGAVKSPNAAANTVAA